MRNGKGQRSASATVEREGISSSFQRGGMVEWSKAVLPSEGVFRPLSRTSASACRS
jgi:hypothetical protein